MDDKTKPDCANCERLRHAWKLTNSLRIDLMTNQGDWCDPDPIEQRLSNIEEVLTP